jgi:hypothetical protein
VSSLSRYRRDAAEPGIIAALEQTGWTVAKIAVRGGPDLLIGRGGATELLEIKTGKYKVQPHQGHWHALWRGKPVRVMRSVADVDALNREIR